MSNDEFTDFGKSDILKSKKTSLVKNLFGEVSENYDLMNDLMSFGVHRLWKESFIDWMAPRKNHHLLDLAGGTGDIGLSYLKRGGGKVTIADLNLKMLSDFFFEDGGARQRWYHWPEPLAPAPSL